jgi:hypothetical protein
VSNSPWFPTGNDPCFLVDLQGKLAPHVAREDQADVLQKMKAEETFGEGGYSYLGNGEYQPHGQMGGPPGQGAPCKLTPV